jgi:Yip1 domain
MDSDRQTLRGESRLIKTLVQIMSDPHATWPLIAAANLDTRDLLLHFTLPFASITATAVTLGVLVLNRDWNFDLGYNIASERAWSIGGATLMFVVLAVCVLAFVFQQLGRIYGSRRDFNAALKVVVFGSVPVWCTGPFMFFMPVILIGMAAFVYCCVLYGIGAQAVLGVKAGDANEFIGIALLLSSVMLTIAGMAAVTLGIL